MTHHYTQNTVLFNVFTLWVVKEACVPGNHVAEQLAFRSTQSLLALKKDHVHRVLHIPPRGSAQHEAAVTGLEAAISMYLRQTNLVLLALGVGTAFLFSGDTWRLFDFTLLLSNNIWFPQNMFLEKTGIFRHVYIRKSAPNVF